MQALGAVNLQIQHDIVWCSQR